MLQALYAVNQAHSQTHLSFSLMQGSAAISVYIAKVSSGEMLMTFSFANLLAQLLVDFSVLLFSFLSFSL